MEASDSFMPSLLYPWWKKKPRCPDIEWRREKCLLLPAIESIFLHYPVHRIIAKLIELSLLVEI